MDHLRDPAAERHLGDLYRGSVDRNGRTIAAAVQHLVQAPEGECPGPLLLGRTDGHPGGHRAGGARDAAGRDHRRLLASELNLSNIHAEMEATPDPTVRARLAELRGAPAPAMEDLLVHLKSPQAAAPPPSVVID